MITASKIRSIRLTLGLLIGLFSFNVKAVKLENGVDYNYGNGAGSPVAEKVAGYAPKDNALEHFTQRRLEAIKQLHIVAKFRRPTYAEYYYADTENKMARKLPDDQSLGKYFAFNHNIDSENEDDVQDLFIPSPCAEGQPRSMFNNAPNALGFRRSGLWEWIEDLDGNRRLFVGGCWRWDNIIAASDHFPHSEALYAKLNILGPAHIVRSN